MASEPTKRKLDTLPNEIIQKIWPLSENPDLPLTSRRLYASLNKEHVRRTFYHELLMNESMVNFFHPPKFIMRLGQIGITGRLLSKALEISKITNRDLWDLSKDVLVTQCAPSIGHVDGWNLVLMAPCKTQVPDRLRLGDHFLHIREMHSYGPRFPFGPCQTCGFDSRSESHGKFLCRGRV